MPRGLKIDMKSHVVHEIVAKPKRRGGTKISAIPMVTKVVEVPSQVKGSQKRARTDEFDHPIPLAPFLPHDSDCFSTEMQSDQPMDAGTDGNHESGVNANIYVKHSGKASQGTTTHQYMDEWSTQKLPSYLARLIHSEGRGSETCENCHSRASDWRCLGCVGQPRLCANCCRVTHRANPLHRVERWSGTHWNPAWLWHVGTVVCLGHGLDPCPQYAASLEQLESRATSINEVDDLVEDPTYGAVPQERFIGSGSIVTIVHTNGFHHLPVFPCSCSNAVLEDIQFLDKGFYPASWKAVATVFTMEALRGAHLMKVQEHMSTDNYCEVLRRLTNPAFPSLAPDRRRELGRAWQQWNHLIDLMKNGYGHVSPGERPGPGDLALFCGACPQPGVNLPDNWASDSTKLWMYRRVLVADGNFVLNHKERKTGDDEPVWLTNGASFMAERDPYIEFLKNTKEPKQTSTCFEHRAITEKNKAKKGYDSTGLVAICCARHGCFAPGSVVDMQKGERQMNVDYALCQAMRNTNADKTPGVVLAYDVNCQYCINFRQRIEQNPFLARLCPTDLLIDFVIGLFHVHGHKDECLYRFAPTYFPGAGVNPGEIIESLWGVLNGAANITRNMTLAHRAEFLDACMQDNNWRKLLGLLNFLIVQFERATSELQAAKAAFEALDKTATAAHREAWTEQMRVANARRSETHGTSMDSYNIQESKIEAADVIQSRMMREEKKARMKGRLGEVGWLARGMALQEEQIRVQELLRSLKKVSPGMQKPKSPSQAHQRKELEVTKRSEKLLLDINQFLDEGNERWPDAGVLNFGGTWEDIGRVNEDRVMASMSGGLCVCEGMDCTCSEDEDNAEEEGRPDAKDGSIGDEFSPLPLPSSFDKIPEGWESLAAKEEKLRVAQANEALESLRWAIAEKSRLYRASRRFAGKRHKTRAFDAVSEVDKRIRFQMKRYKLATMSLRGLGVSNQYPQFQSLTRAHVGGVTAVYDPNKSGERNKGLSWIWHIDVKGDSSNSKYLEDVYRASWIRARSRYDRWQEELEMVTAEMDWYVRFLEYHRDWCLQWTQLGLGGGHDAFGHRQADMWRRLAQQARKQFLKKSGVVIPDRDVSESLVKTEEEEEEEEKDSVKPGPVKMEEEEEEEKDSVKPGPVKMEEEEDMEWRMPDFTGLKSEEDMEDVRFHGADVKAEDGMD